MLPKCQQQLVTTLHRVGAFKINTKNGFRLAAHDKNPAAPLSPFYVNLRTDSNPKPGPLTSDVVHGIGVEIFEAANKARFNFDAICGIPNAGKPFAHAVESHMRLLRRNVRHICLKKEETATGKRSFKVHSDYRAPTIAPARVLLVDDLITTASVKELAIAALQRAGHTVVGVAVFLDRRKHRSQAPLKNGVRCVAAVHIDDVLDVYRDRKLITPDDMEVIKRYLAAA